MLYERWRQIVRERGSLLALYDLPSGRCWTFSELCAEAESRSRQPGAIVFPQGATAEFVFDVLSAWRHGQCVCPLEMGQRPFEISDPPRGCDHLKTTSASTGAPRIIAFRQEQLLADAENIVATMNLRPDWPNLGVISLAHSYGFSNLILPLLLNGIPLILGGSPLPETIRQAAAVSSSLALPAVPALWRAWHEAGAIVPNIKLAISAGAPLPLALEEEIFTKWHLKIHNFYGSSECGGIAYDGSFVPRTDAACVGAAMQRVQLHVGEDGCLEVRSRAVGETYWPDANDRLANGCYRTSDIAELVDGAVYLRGRAGDLMNIAGRKLAPEVVECALRRHAAVRECLVFGLAEKNSQRGETIVACIARSGETSLETFREFLLAKLPAWQVPREWWFVDQLETNERGKLSRAEWRKRYLAMKNQRLD